MGPNRIARTGIRNASIAITIYADASYAFQGVRCRLRPQNPDRACQPRPSGSGTLWGRDWALRDPRIGLIRYQSYLYVARGRTPTKGANKGCQPRLPGVGTLWDRGARKSNAHLDHLDHLASPSRGGRDGRPMRNQGIVSQERERMGHPDPCRRPRMPTPTWHSWGKTLAQRVHSPIRPRVPTPPPGSGILGQ